MRREDLRVVVEGALVWDTVLDLDLVLDVGATLDFLVMGESEAEAGALVGQLLKKDLLLG